VFIIEEPVKLAGEPQGGIEADNGGQVLGGLLVAVREQHILCACANRQPSQAALAPAHLYYALPMEQSWKKTDQADMRQAFKINRGFELTMSTAQLGFRG
jgi:hypothetical protein